MVDDIIIREFQHYSGSNLGLLRKLRELIAGNTDKIRVVVKDYSLQERGQSTLHYAGQNSDLPDKVYSSEEEAMRG